MDHTDPAGDRDPLRRLAEAALARQEAAQRQRPTTRAPSTATKQHKPRRPTTPRPSPRPNSWPPRCSGPRAPSWPQA
jgi:hypothetical protein